jgi:hypothetical protein
MISTRISIGFDPLPRQHLYHSTLLSSTLKLDNDDELEKLNDELTNASVLLSDEHKPAVSLVNSSNNKSEYVTVQRALNLVTIKQHVGVVDLQVILERLVHMFLMSAEMQLLPKHRPKFTKNA